MGEIPTKKRVDYFCLSALGRTELRFFNLSWERGSSGDEDGFTFFCSLKSRLMEFLTNIS
jgi:hypothetical protein